VVIFTLLNASHPQSSESTADGNRSIINTPASSSYAPVSEIHQGKTDPKKYNFVPDMRRGGKKCPHKFL